MPIYAAVASHAETAEFRAALLDGLGWGDAKQQLFERLERDIAPMRARYEELIAQPARIEEILQAGAARARAIGAPFLAELREAVGLRSFRPVVEKKTVAAATARLPQFKQYREADGKFYFKLLDADGRLLLQSDGFDSPKAAGQSIASLRAAASLASVADGYALGPDVSAAEVEQALAALAQ